MIEKDKKIINKLGMHARAAAKLLDTANQFSSSIRIQHQEKSCDAKSILGLMTLAASCGTTIKVTADGKDETQAIEAISNLIDNYFDEGE